MDEKKKEVTADHHHWRAGLKLIYKKNVFPQVSPPLEPIIIFANDGPSTITAKMASNAGLRSEQTAIGWYPSA